jgi:single stranded DNA-binding protein
MNINRVTLTGNLTADPDERALPTGTSVTRLRLAVNTRRKNGSTGEWEEKANYFNVTVWGAQGENCARYLSKGRPVAIDGRLERREYTTQDGQRREAVEVTADTVQFLGGGREQKVNVTDPDSRPIPIGFGFVQGYNAQTAVDEEQIVLAAEITNLSTDFSQLSPMVAAVLRELGRAGIDHKLLEAVAADAGYWNEQQMDDVVNNRHLPVLVAPDRGSRGTPKRWQNEPRANWMRTVMKSDHGRERYAKRKQTVEPLYGDTKHNKGFIRFHRRGRIKVRTEFRLLMMAHNLTKDYRHRIATVGAWKKRLPASIFSSRSTLRRRFRARYPNSRRPCRPGSASSKRSPISSTTSFPQSWILVGSDCNVSATSRQQPSSQCAPPIGEEQLWRS